MMNHPGSSARGPESGKVELAMEGAAIFRDEEAVDFAKGLTPGAGDPG
jgi:hypothetical protein